MADRQDIKPVITPQGTIKVEGQSSMVRLASFRMPRDLTLGGSNVSRRGGFPFNAPAKGKRTFTPNVNVQRNKPKEEVKVKEEPAWKNKNARGHAAPTRGGRGRGRNIIQSTGVFSEGMGSNDYQSSRSRFGGGGGGGGDGGASEAIILKPKVDFKATLKADAKEEDARLKLLLRDDFIDDPETDGPKVAPIQLPVSAKILGKTVIKKEEVKEEITQNGTAVADVKIKKEPVDDFDNINDASDVGKDLEDEKGFYEFLSEKEAQFILLQLPDCLPGLRPSTEPDNPKQAQSTSAGTSTDESQHPKQQCTLSSLSDCQLGQIELLRSGAARLRIGELTFPLSLGTQAGFRQDVVAVELDESTKSGDMINLGSIQMKMMASPDWDLSLLKNCSRT